jgi:hypothetical protein
MPETPIDAVQVWLEKEEAAMAKNIDTTPPETGPAASSSPWTCENFVIVVAAAGFTLYVQHAPCTMPA